MNPEVQRPKLRADIAGWSALAFAFVASAFIVAAGMGIMHEVHRSAAPVVDCSSKVVLDEVQRASRAREWDIDDEIKRIGPGLANCVSQELAQLPRYRPPFVVIGITTLGNSAINTTLLPSACPTGQVHRVLDASGVAVCEPK